MIFEKAYTYTPPKHHTHEPNTYGYDHNLHYRDNAPAS